MKNIIPVLILSISMTACASRTTRVNKAMNTWLNQSIEEKISQSGPPSSVFNLSNGKIYSWVYVGNTRTLYLPAGNTVISRNRTPVCQLDYTTDLDGKIVAYRWEGNC